MVLKHLFKTSCLPLILKEVIDALLPYICDLVNKSLASGSVEGMKESVVVPLLKKAGLDAEILKNYRPVHDLVFLSKLSERVVNRRLHGHMNLNLLHSKYEHGYKKNFTLLKHFWYVYSMISYVHVTLVL